MNNILIADDDIELCQLLKDYLSQEGFDVYLVHTGQAAIENARSGQHDLLILDVMMPEKNGFEALAEIRQKTQLPIIMLTARGDKVDRIVGLEMGADDYVAKPCDPRELVARIRAVTRRLTQVQTNQAASDFIKVDDVSLDLGNRQVKVGEAEIELTSTEFDLLKLLMENAGSLVSRESISEVCLGKKLQPFDRSIDMHLSNVRKKLGVFEFDKERIKTIRGNGYQYLVWSH